MEPPGPATPFDPQPTLEGALVRLRPLRAEDHDALYAAASDPLIWEQHPDTLRYTPEGFDRYFRGALESGSALVVLDAATGRIIGSSRYHGHDPARSEVEIGWTFLARAYWGGRYNGEMKRLMLAHAFRSVRTVVFLVAPANLRSQRAVERIGGVRAGTRRGDQGRESVLFVLTADDFARRGPG